MTEREMQILELIRLNPMMTQQELSNKLGIERSSVAVHISNLIKKGKIVGRGYVLACDKRVLVIGGSNMDIIGISQETLVLRDSNRGGIKIQPGGVGRNIAECLAGLKVPVKLITTLGKDAFGHMIEEDARSKGIHTESIIWEEHLGSSIYLSLHDRGGDMLCALNHMANMENFTPDKLKTMESEIKLAELVIVDANLPQETLAQIVNLNQGTVFAEGVSAHKVLRLLPLLPKIHTLKINQIEARALTGLEVNSTVEAEQAGKKLVDKGVKKVYITLGSAGAIGIDCKGASTIHGGAPLIINTNGAGDAFMAGLVFAHLNTLEMSEALKLAMACADESMAVEGVFPTLVKNHEVLKYINEQGH